jgi:hypothetical protein
MIRILEELMKSPQSFREDKHQKEKSPTKPAGESGSPCNARFFQGDIDEPVGHNNTPNAREAEESVAEKFSGHVLSGWLQVCSRPVRRQ